MIGILVPAVPAGTSDQAKEPTPREFRASTYQVSVDFVARDKQGHGIEDLTPAEVEVYEDGVRQDIRSLRLVHRSAPRPVSASDSAPPPRGPAGPAIVPPEGPEILAILLDNISLTHSDGVRRALREHFASHWREGQQVGVFVVVDRMAVSQPFTSDRKAILEGVDRALDGHGTRTVARQSDVGVGAVNRRLPGMVAFYPRDRDPAAGGGGRDPSSNASLSRDDLHGADMPGPSGLDPYDPGLTTVYSLEALVNAMSAARGRKAIVFMTEAFRLSPRAEMHFASLVAAANEAQVSIYSVDAAGLRTDSPNERLRQDFEAAADPIRHHIPVDPIFGTPIDADAEVLPASMPRALFLVADSTGGAAIQDTNDLALGLAKADEDLGDYYLLSYSPRNENFDGRFREITVKVRRLHGDVRARKGYLALRTRTWADPVLAYEGPALARLEKTPKADQFPVHAQAVVLPTGSAGAITAVHAELLEGAMRLDLEKKAGFFHQDFSIVAVVRDGSGTVVRKMSQYYPLKAPLDQLDQAKRNTVRFYKETELPPGPYAVEVVVHDNSAGAASVRRMAVDVPEAGGQRLKASAVFLMGHAGEGLGDNPRSTPVVVNGVELFPLLDATLPQASSEAEFFLRAWPAAGRERVDADFTLVRGGEVVVGQRIAPLVVDGSGEINMLTRVSVTKLPPGSYYFNVTLSDGQDRASRAVGLTIASSGTPSP